jgi:glycosyl-4,4'-diaponeurosporenoate acyltransferase
MISALVPGSLRILILLNSAAWFLAIFIPGAIIQKMSILHFRERSFLFRIRSWEESGVLYRTLGVREWKELKADRAGIFQDGFRKRRMHEHDEFYLKRFILETCRAELVHWVILAETLLFFLWNPLSAALLMIPFSLLINLPCIMVQRYNRPRLRRLLDLEQARMRRKEGYG